MPVFFFLLEINCSIAAIHSLSANVAILKVLIFGVCFCQLYPVVFKYILCIFIML